MNGRFALLAGLFLCSLTLRPQLTVVGPLLPRIENDLDVSHGVAGLLGTIPVFCMGAFAPAAAFVANRLGWRHALALSLALIAAAGTARSLVPGTAAVLLLTIPVGVGIAIGGTLLPVSVKERFSDRPGLATGMYTAGILLGSGLGAALAVPLALAVRGWRTPFLAISVATAVLVPAFVLLSRGEPAHVRTTLRPPELPWRSLVGWWLVGVFALQGLTYYGLNAWLADSYVERGWKESTAGGLVTLLNAASLPGAFVVLWFADRASRQLQLVLTTFVMTLAVVGIVTVPGGAWVWTTVVGVCGGIVFSLLLLLPLDAADDPAQVGAFAGMMLGVGYAITALAPFVLGAVRDATGSFTTTLWLMVGTAGLLTVGCVAFDPRWLHARRAEAEPLAALSSGAGIPVDDEEVGRARLLP